MRCRTIEPRPVLSAFLILGDCSRPPRSPGKAEIRDLTSSRPRRSTRS